MKFADRLRDGIESFAERYLSGHLRLGPVMLYGANAMDWAVNVRLRTLGVTLCAKLPTARRGWYVYASPNGTPWAAVIGAGPGLERGVGERIAERLDILEASPHREDEAGRIWALWGPKVAEGAEEVGVFHERKASDPPRVRRFTSDN